MTNVKVKATFIERFPKYKKYTILVTGLAGPDLIVKEHKIRVIDENHDTIATFTSNV